MQITQQDRHEWANSKVTREFLSGLEASLLETMEAWSDEAFVASTGEGSAIANATALGGVRVLKQLIEQIFKTAKTSEEL